MSSGPLRLLSGEIDSALIVVQSALREDRGLTVVLRGAAGAGKSTTMDRLAEALAGSVSRITRVSADETSRRQPFGVVSAMVGIPAEYPPRPDTADRILVAVEDLCATGPAVLCADDLHQADADSLRVIGQLAEATRDLPLVLLLTRRWFPVRESLDALSRQHGVLSVEVTGVDADGVAGIVRQRFGAEPGPTLRHALQTTGGNPFHLQGLLADLHRSGRVAVADGVAEIVAEPADRAGTSVSLPSMQDSVRAQLSLLDGRTYDLLQILAVWGRPASADLLADIAGLPAADVHSSIQSAIDVEVIGRTADRQLTFVHDLYRDVLYDDLLPGLRRMLHAVCAEQLRVSGGRGTEIVQHVGDSLADGVAVAEALRIARTDLQFAPEQAADLLAQVHTRPGTDDADAVAVARAGALAAAGRMAEMDRVVRQALAVTRSAVVHNTLTRLLLHSMVSAARSTEAIALIDDELTRPSGEGYHEALSQLRRWVLVLTGDVRVAGGRASAGGSSGAALVPSALELFLQARCSSALDLVLRAQQAREESGSPTWSDGATAPVWPGWFALYARGPAAAMELSKQARRTAQQAGRGWLFPQHLGVAGAIDRFAGRWDDAVTVLDAQAEIFSNATSGWRSRGLGDLLQIRIQRGELDEARTELDAWFARKRHNQFGLPWLEWAELQLLEAGGDAEAARQLAHRIWTPPLDGGRVIWAPLAGPDVARIAVRTNDAALLDRVRRDCAAVALDEAPVLVPSVALVEAIATGSPADAVAATQSLRSSGWALGEVYGWEEAAVAAAATQEREAAREYASRCLRLTGALGAQTVERRLAGRLRDHGVRLGATGSRRRPATGRASLTPTEQLVADKVTQGLSSPQIAAELFLSPRTVQTHVSHILRKLQFRSRSELAAAFARDDDAVRVGS